MKKRAYISLTLGLGVVTSLAFALPAFAENSVTPGNPPAWTRKPEDGKKGGMMGMRPAVFGTVSAISGNTITVTGKQFAPRQKGTSGTTPSPLPDVTYTVDATNAKVTKDNATSTVANIMIGDTLAVQGTVSGTNVTATIIHDGAMMRGKGFGKNDGTKTSPIQGNGSPLIAGTVSSLSGSIITITNKSNTSYTVDATNAQIYEGKTTADISSIKVGDSIVAQGTVNGTSMTATTVIDHKQPAEPAQGQTQGTAHPGLWGRIGNFFRNLF